jgi:Flp pilus assembly protein TadD
MRGRTIRASQLAQQRRDTPEDILRRQIRQVASAYAIEDRKDAFPRLDETNADAAIAYQEHAAAFHERMIADVNRPNWRRSYAEAEKLVRSYVAWKPSDGRALELLAAVCERIVETGEGVWHATAQISGRPCPCATCSPAVRS